MSGAESPLAAGRTITVAPLTRIEGHGRITLQLDASGRLAQARFHVDEFRGFESFCLGRPYGEMGALTARICGICPVSHLLAAGRAGDRLLGAAPPPAAQRLRTLLNLAQICQSHALSFFHLSSPDWLLGWESDPARRNLFGLIAADPELARAGIGLRRFGQELIARLAGARWSALGHHRDDTALDPAAAARGAGLGATGAGPLRAPARWAAAARTGQLRQLPVAVSGAGGSRWALVLR
jgi:NAD-reducing hydrogenase large subunit